MMIFKNILLNNLERCLKNGFVFSPWYGTDHIKVFNLQNNLQMQVTSSSVQTRTLSLFRQRAVGSPLLDVRLSEAHVSGAEIFLQQMRRSQQIPTPRHSPLGNLCV